MKERGGVLEGLRAWRDGLHFTPKGYERMGKLVAARLFEIIDAKITAEVLAES